LREEAIWLASGRTNIGLSPSAAETIVDVAATLGASRVILGAPQRSALINLLRGNVIREVSNSLPDDIDLLVYA
jgi:nucleotide-binding universal stress UspA family protein